MEDLIRLAVEDPDFVELLFRLVERQSRIDVARVIRLMNEELDDINAALSREAA